MKRFAALGGVVALSLSSLAGCGAADGTLDENLGETTQAVMPDPTMPDPAAGPVKLHNLQTSRCLGVAAGTPTPGNFLIVWTPCDGSANQNWQYVTRPDFNHNIKNFVADDRFLSIRSIQANHYAGNGNVAIIDVANNDDIFKEFWTMTFVGPDLMGHNCYYFSSGWGAGQVLGVLGGNPNNGARVVTWQGFFTDFQHHQDQLWCAY